jgi:hypothetical protein
MAPYKEWTDLTGARRRTYPVVPLTDEEREWRAESDREAKEFEDQRHRERVVKWQITTPAGRTIYMSMSVDEEEPRKRIYFTKEWQPFAEFSLECLRRANEQERKRGCVATFDDGARRVGLTPERYDLLKARLQSLGVHGREQQ